MATGAASCTQHATTCLKSLLLVLSHQCTPTLNQGASRSHVQIGWRVHYGAFCALALVHLTVDRPTAAPPPTISNVSQLVEIPGIRAKSNFFRLGLRGGGVLICLIGGTKGMMSFFLARPSLFLKVIGGLCRPACPRRGDMAMLVQGTHSLLAHPRARPPLPLLPIGGPPLSPWSLRPGTHLLLCRALLSGPGRGYVAF